MNTTHNNLFTGFQEKKKQVCNLAESALKAGWLDEVSYNQIISKINDDILTIGVIGQMKCGKSTFLNSFLFGEQLLPAATTPMTAALSVITYGSEKKVEAEFYTTDEWEELKSLSEQDENEVSDSSSKSSIKAAKELFAKSASIRQSLPNLLGTKKIDEFDNLIEYVGADGKYVSIVKSVRITLPEEWLKGVEIVDTPGFNDPVVSREERTKEFLKRADVVLMMLYAGRPFDATDRDILFDKVRKVGIGKIILAVNKYDIQVMQGETPEMIKGFVMDELTKTMRQIKDDSISELLSDIDPILISAQMALLAKMSMSQINNDPDLKHHYKKLCDEFEITTQPQMLKLSNIDELEQKVRDLISTQKEEILIRKPVNQIFQKAKNIIDDLNFHLTELKELKTNLELPEDELEAKIANYESANRRINRKIEQAESNLSDAYDKVSRKIIRDIQDKADNAKDDCERIITQYKKKELQHRLTLRLEKFKERELPRELEDTRDKIVRELRNNINQLSEDVEGVINKYLDGSFEIVEDFRSILNKGLNIEMDADWECSKKDPEQNSISFIAGFGIGILFPIWGIPVSLYHLLDNGRDEARKLCNEFFHSIDWEAMSSKLAEGRESFIKALNGDAARILIDRLAEKANEAMMSKADKENKLEEVNAEIAETESKKKQIVLEYEQLKCMVG